MAAWFARNRGILVAIAVLALPLAIIVPLPSFLLDLLLSANLLLATVILFLTALVPFVRRKREFLADEG